MGRRVCVVSSIVVVLSAFSPLVAQPGAEPAASPPPVSSPAAVVVEASSSRAGQPRRVGLGDRLRVRVDHLDALLGQTGGDCQKIVLFLDNMAFPCSTPLACEGSGTVVYQLTRSYEQDCAQAELQNQHWHMLFGRPTRFVRPLKVSVGPTDDLPLVSKVEGFQLQVVSARGFYFGSAVLLLLWFAMFRLGRRSDLLRDTQAVVGPGERRPFSLSRLQMGFWFLLVVSAFFFIWVLTNEVDTITPSILGLIGIGSGTALGATMIDASKQTAEGAQENRGQLRQAGTPTKAGTSGSFMQDILTNASGISLHRFQLLVWTFVLGIVFVVSVYRQLSMPDFNTTLLGLMGISSGTYLGFKLPERYAADPPATPPPPPTR